MQEIVAIHLHASVVVISLDWRLKMKHKISLGNVSEADIRKCEEDLQHQMGVSILFLNYHGVAIDRVREMIIDALDRSIEHYEDADILKTFKEKINNV